MRIGEVSERSGVPAKTIRYYESVGLLPPPRRTRNGYRDYDETVLGRLAFIRAAQASALTLGEIRGVLAFRDRGDTPCDHVRMLIDRRAGELDERIAALQGLRSELTRLAARARRLDPADCEAASVCHILAVPAR